MRCWEVRDPIALAFKGIVSEIIQFYYPHMDSLPVAGHCDFGGLLHAQIRRHFTAAHQYIAMAVFLDKSRLRRLAQRFYLQAQTERVHALCIIRYLLDRGASVEISGTDQFTSAFQSVSDVVSAAVDLEYLTLSEITKLASAARSESDYLGEQFMQWLLKEKAATAASMSKLLTVVQAASQDLLQVESYAARELNNRSAPDPAGPRPAGGIR